MDFNTQKMTRKKNDQKSNWIWKKTPFIRKYIDNFFCQFSFRCDRICLCKLSISIDDNGVRKWKKATTTTTMIYLQFWENGFFDFFTLRKQLFGVFFSNTISNRIHCNLQMVPKPQFASIYKLHIIYFSFSKNVLRKSKSKCKLLLECA